MASNFSLKKKKSRKTEVRWMIKAQAERSFIKARTIKRGFCWLGFVLISAVFAGCNIQSGRNHYVLAERLFNDQKYTASVQEFQKIVDNDPKSLLAQQSLFRIGLIQYLYLKDYYSAVKNFRQFIALSQNKELVFEAEKYIGELYFQKLEDYRASLDHYVRMTEKYPDAKEKIFFMFRVAKSYYGLTDFKRAIEAFLELIHDFPGTELALESEYQIANTFYTRGDCEQAIQKFQDIIRQKPGTRQAVFSQFGIANCYEELEKPKEALEEYEKIPNQYITRSIVVAKIKRLREKEAKKNR